MPVQQHQECWNCGHTNIFGYEVCVKCGEYCEDPEELPHDYDLWDDEVEKEEIEDGDLTEDECYE